MKARKRFLSVLLGAAMSLTMTTAVFAAEEAIGQLPVEVVEVSGVSEEENGRPIPEILTVSDEDIAATPMAISELEGDGSKENPYLIKEESDFESLITILSTYQGETNIRLETSIDLSKISSGVSEWKGYWKFFRGEFDGQGNTIYGLPKNCYLIENWVGGTIKDLTLDLQGQAGTLVYCPARISQGGTVKYLPAMLEKIKIKSDTEIQLTEGNKQANYAPFIFSSGMDFVMKDCVNYADISGNTYASVFYGYYPMANASADVERIRFENCANHGDVTYQYAGLLFGNPTGLFYKNFEFDRVKNYGKLRGTESVHYFSSDANSIDAIPSYETEGSFMYEQEAKLPEVEVNGACDDEACPKYKSEAHKAGKYVGEKLDGFGVRSEKNEFVVSLPKASSVDHYKASAFCYVSEFEKNETGEFISNGTNRMILNQEFTSAEETFTITKFKDYPVQDGTMPEIEEWEEVLDVNGLYFFIDGDASCYWLDNSELQPGECKWYLNGDQTPGSVNWQFYVSAYDDKGHLLDTAVLERNEGE